MNKYYISVVTFFFWCIHVPSQIDHIRYLSGLLEPQTKHFFSNQWITDCFMDVFVF